MEMEIDWLKDFIALARLRHFSQAVNKRNVFQPVFSGRIQALEARISGELIDHRSTTFRGSELTVS